MTSGNHVARSALSKANRIPPVARGNVYITAYCPTVKESITITAEVRMTHSEGAAITHREAVDSCAVLLFVAIGVHAVNWRVVIHLSAYLNAAHAM